MSAGLNVEHKDGYAFDAGMLVLQSYLCLFTPFPLLFSFPRENNFGGENPASPKGGISIHQKVYFFVRHVLEGRVA